MPLQALYRHLRGVLMVCSLSLTLVPCVHAQSSAEVNAAGLQFNLSNPGARSMGLGGAFTGLADDATAAYANPAGLIRMSLPEISIEGRHSDYENFYTDRGRSFGSPSHEGIDTISGLAEGSSRDRVNGLSFLSFVYPRGRWAVALYRHELGKFQSSAQTQGMFLGPPTDSNRFYPSASSLTLGIESYGGAFAYRLSDHFAVGASAARYQFDLRSVTNRYFFNEVRASSPGAFYGPPLYDPANVVNSQTQNGSDSAIGWNGGVLWTPSRRISLGAVYKRGSDFGLTVQSVAGPSSAVPGRVDVAAKARFHVPTSYGAGVTFRPTEVTMLSFDWNRILYSSLTRDFVTIFSERNLYRVSDGTELHAGFEYIVTRTRYPIVFRVGAWIDPDHRIRYSDPADPQSLLFRAGKDDRHVTAGTGIAVGKYYQIDVAVDHSRRQQVGSISVVTRF